MSTRTKTILMTAAGVLAGGVMFVVGALQTGGGHGHYDALAAASMPGLVLGVGTPLAAVVMIGFPLAQWGFLGFCVSRVLFAGRPLWSLGLVATGLAYWACAWLGYETLKSLAPWKLDSPVKAGLLAGTALIGAGCLFLVLCSPRRP